MGVFDWLRRRSFDDEQKKSGADDRARPSSGVGPGARPLPPRPSGSTAPRNTSLGPGARPVLQPPSGRSVPPAPGSNRGGASQGNAPIGVRAPGITATRALFDPSLASPETQRALRSFGWAGEQQQLGALPGWRTEGEREDFGPHTFKLPDWQAEQIEQDYGYSAPDEMPELKGSRFAVGAIQRADYDSLSDKQKRALEFNKLLTDAVRQDRALSGPAEGTDMEAYGNRVREMFGTQGGSETYAPNTMALLEGLGMGRLRNQDLDEYLSLDRAFTDREVAALQQWDEVPELEQKGYAASRTASNSQVLDMMQIDLAGEAIEAALAPGNVNTYGWDDQSRIAKQLGYTLDPAQTPAGWLVGMDDEKIKKLRGGEDSDEYRKERLYQDLYNFLQSRQTEASDDFWLITEDIQFTDQDYEEIFDYFYLRSLEDDRVGVTDPQYRTGQELRDFIGIG